MVQIRLMRRVPEVAGAERNAAGWRAQVCGVGSAGEEMQEARDGRLKIDEGRA